MGITLRALTPMFLQSTVPCMGLRTLPDTHSCHYRLRVSPALIKDFLISYLRSPPTSGSSPKRPDKRKEGKCTGQHMVFLVNGLFSPFSTLGLRNCFQATLRVHKC